MGKSSFTPTKRGGGGAENLLAMLKGGGGRTSFDVVLTVELEVLAILNGGL